MEPYPYEEQVLKDKYFKVLKDKYFKIQKLQQLDIVLLSDKNYKMN